MRPETAAYWYANRKRFGVKPEKMRRIMLYARAKLECQNRGHAFDKGQCLRCGDLAPEVQSAFAQIAKAIQANGAEGNDHDEPKPAP